MRKQYKLEERGEILKKTNGVCAHCGRGLDIHTMTVEHIYPVSKGGEDTEFNIVPLCKECNYNKSDSIYDVGEYYPYILVEYRRRFFEEFVRELYIGKAPTFLLRADDRIVPYLPENYIDMLAKSCRNNKKAIQRAKKSLEKMVVKLQITKAYPASAERIAKLVDKYKSSPTSLKINAEYYSVHYNILEDMRTGFVFEITNNGETCGALVFKPISNEIANLPQIKNIEENTTLKAGVILTLAIVSKRHNYGSKYLMASVLSMFRRYGLIPIFNNIIDNRALPYKELIRPTVRYMDTNIEIQFPSLRALRHKEENYVEKLIQSVDEMNKFSNFEIAEIADMMLNRSGEMDYIGVDKSRVELWNRFVDSVYIKKSDKALFSTV